MKRLSPAAPNAAEPTGSAAVAKQRLLVALAADRRSQPATTTPRPDAQFLAQLLATTPKRGA